MAQINKLKIPNFSSNNIIMTDENGIVTDSGISVDSVKNAVSVKQHYLDLTEITGTNITKDNEPIYTNIVNMITDYFNNDTLNIIIKTKTDTIIDEYTVSLKVNGNVIDLINNQPDITNDNKGTVSADFNRSILTIALNDDEEHSINTITINTNKTTIGVLDTNNTDTGDSVTYLPTTDSQPANKKYVDQQDLGLQTQITDLQDKAQDIVENISTEQAEYLTILNRNSCPGQLTVIGQSTQATRSGKNMINIIKPTTTVAGVTFTNNYDGSVTINGTATSNAYFNLNVQDESVRDYFTLTNNETYGLYLGVETSVQLVARSASKNYALLQTESGTMQRIQQYTDETDNQCYAYLTVASGKTINNLTVYPMIIQGSEIGNFEQYGMSPSVNYPSPIRNTGDSKNIFDGELEQGFIVNHTGVNVDRDDSIRSKNYIEIPDNITKLRCIRSIATNSFGLRFYDKDKSFIQYVSGFPTTASIIDFDILHNAKYIRFVDLSNNLQSKYMITIDLGCETFSEFNTSNIQIFQCNDNLCNTNLIKSIGNTALTVNSTNSFTIDVSKQNIAELQFIDLFFNGNDKNAQYTLSYHIHQNSETFLPNLGFIYEDGTKTAANNTGETDLDLTVSSEKNKIIKAIVIGWRTQTQGGIVTFSDIYLKKLNNTNPYTDQQYQNILFPLSNNQVLYNLSSLRQNGIYNKMKQVKIDLSKWSIEMADTDIVCITNNTETNTSWDYNSTNAYCTHFINANDSNITGQPSASSRLQNNQFNVRMGNIKDRIYFKYDQFTSLDQWKDFFNNNEVIIQYECNEYINTYTSEQQSIANQINGLVLYKGINNIYTISDTQAKLQLNSSVQGYIDAKFNIVDQQIGAIESKVDTILG